MRKIALLFILSFVFTSKVFGNLPVLEIDGMDKAQRLELVNAYRKFLVSMELASKAENEKAYSKILLEKFFSSFMAYAAIESDCLYAGWPSRRGPHGYCERPETNLRYKVMADQFSNMGFGNDNPAGFVDCTGNERRCNPIVFGPVCAPFDTKYNRVRATSNCEKASTAMFPDGFDYKSYLSEQVGGDSAQGLIKEFDKGMEELQKSAQNVCSNPDLKQSKTVVCSILKQRLGDKLPYYASSSAVASTSNGAASYTPQREVSQEGLEQLELDINELNIEIDKLVQGKECTSPEALKVVNKRYNVRQLINPKDGEFLSEDGSKCLMALKPLLEKRANLLREYRQTLGKLSGGELSCSQIDPLAEQNELARQYTDLNKAAAAKACEENPQKWNAQGCAGDFACAIGSSLFYGGPMNKLGAAIGNKLGFSPDCLNGNNNCFAKIATAAADVVWSFLQSMPDLGKLAWEKMKQAGEKIKSWMPWATETEQKMSDANQAAMNVMEEDEESTLSKIGSFFKNIWTMLKEYITDDLMCTEPGWELERFKKNAHCDQPFVSWNCLTCAGAISGVCNVVGAVGSEVIIGILTGGTASSIKAGVKAVSVGVKAATRAALKSQIKGIAGVGLKALGKTSKALKLPVTLTKSTIGKSKVFLANQGAKFGALNKWVSKNVNKVTTPIVKKNQLASNLVEIAGDAAVKTGNRIKKAAISTVKLPLTVSQKTLKVAGRILDPFKLGEKGFALGYNAMNGLIPMQRFTRIASFGQDLANATELVNATSKANAAVDASMNLIAKAKNEIDEMIKAAQKGTLTQEEFNQVKAILELQGSIKGRFASNTNAMARLDNIEKPFLEKVELLERVMGKSAVSRFEEYSKASYYGVEKGKVRVVGSGSEKTVNGFEYTAKESGDILVKTRPRNEAFLIVDHVDGQYIAINRKGERALFSSGNFDKNVNKHINAKLNAKSDGRRFEELEELASNSSLTSIRTRIAKANKAQELPKGQMPTKFKKIPDVAEVNKTANKNRGPASKSDFGKNSKDNVKINNKTYSALFSTKTDHSGAYLKVVKDGAVENVRIFDESTNSFIGRNAQGKLVEVKKSVIPKTSRQKISNQVATIHPEDKAKALSANGLKKKVDVVPQTDPDFAFETPLRKNEIRVGSDAVPIKRYLKDQKELDAYLVDGGTVNLRAKAGDPLKIKNVKEQGEHWVGVDANTGKEIIIPKSLLDNKANNLLAKGWNFTKLKYSLRKNLPFVKSIEPKTGKIDVDRAFRAKYRYANFYIKARMTKAALGKMHSSELEQISENVYLRAISASEAQVINVDAQGLEQWEEDEMNKALEEAVSSEDDFDFESIDENDLDF